MFELQVHNNINTNITEGSEEIEGELSNCEHITVACNMKR